MCRFLTLSITLIALTPSSEAEVLPADLAVILSRDAYERLPMQGPWFPRTWYDAVLTGYERTSVGRALEFENRLEDWQLVSMRIVPCGPLGAVPTANQETLCWPGIRLVWQPVVDRVLVGGRWIRDYADDRAIHALYDTEPSHALSPEVAAQARNLLLQLQQGQSLSPNETANFVEAQRAVATNLIADAVGLRAPDLSESAYAALDLRPEVYTVEQERALVDRLRSFLTRHAQPKALTAMTSFSLPEGRQPAHLDEWVFLAFRGVGGDLVPANIEIRDHVTGAVRANLGHSTRASMRRDDPRLYDLPADALASLRDSVALFGNDLERLESTVRDRRLRLVPNTSCGTCHKFNAEPFDFHNLSYLEDRSVTIAPRVRTDVALDLAWVQSNLLPQ